jgi:glycosyltransferase involved in cell wall biosynthesis
MRVLLISHTCQSRTEGQAKAEAISRLPDVELRVLVPHRWKHYGQWRMAEVPSCAKYEYQVGRVRLPWAGPGQFYLHWYPELERVLREFRPDVIDVWEEPWAAVSAQVCWLRERVLPDAKVISETEQNISKRLPPPFEWFRRYVLRRAEFVVGRSTEAVEVVRAKGYRGPAGVVGNGVDAGLFRRMDRYECRRALGWEEEMFTVGYVGRLVEEKGVLDLVEAVGLCEREVRGVFVGSGPKLGKLQGMSRRQTAGSVGERVVGLEVGWGERVRVLPGRPLEELPLVMNALDVLVLPSRTTHRWKEQFGRVIIEAHACGVPVIGSDSGAIPEVVGEGGLIVPEGRPVELARAIDRLRNEPKLSQELGERGRQQVMQRYTWQRVAEQMREIYQRCLDLPVTGHGRIEPIEDRGPDPARISPPFASGALHCRENG